ncbi:MAG: hypothetical protein U9N46_11060 [Euryarchaeota archaeon]|nr:hypothetical protein [Euryarchaeota archaeon]
MRFKSIEATVTREMMWGSMIMPQTATVMEGVTALGALMIPQPVREKCLLLM